MLGAMNDFPVTLPPIVIPSIYVPVFSPSKTTDKNAESKAESKDIDHEPVTHDEMVEVLAYALFCVENEEEAIRRSEGRPERMEHTLQVLSQRANRDDYLPRARRMLQYLVPWTVKHLFSESNST